ncbi:hypothetical protein [Leifsonia sp. fls2-241-R2A-40a]|uniref:hypothetical protein n=1 Tax=Leifsonia sp. fls2-241-R2A-40a TaxID=3040290 RepID=UPI00254CDB23|nr:hypothetical protein [Leifsonia sp. fls2-241-R2A-40a]
MITASTLAPATLTGAFRHVTFVAETIDWICRTRRLIDPVTRQYAAPQVGMVDAIRLPVIVPARDVAFEDLVVLFGDRRVFAGVRSYQWDGSGQFGRSVLTEAIEATVRGLRNAAQTADPNAVIRYLDYTPTKHH